MPNLGSYFASTFSLVYIDHLFNVTIFTYQLLPILVLHSLISCSVSSSLTFRICRKNNSQQLFTDDVKAALDKSRPKYYSTNTSSNLVIRFFCNLNNITVSFSPILLYWSISWMNYLMLYYRKIYFLLLQLYALLAMSKVLYYM